MIDTLVSKRSANAEKITLQYCKPHDDEVALCGADNTTTTTFSAWHLDGIPFVVALRTYSKTSNLKYGEDGNFLACVTPCASWPNGEGWVDADRPNAADEGREGDYINYLLLQSHRFLFFLSYLTLTELRKLNSQLLYTHFSIVAILAPCSITKIHDAC